MNGEKDDLSLINNWINKNDPDQSHGKKGATEIVDEADLISSFIKGGHEEKCLPIAITGLSGFFPDSMNVQSFWDKLDRDESLIREVPSERFDWKQFYAKDEVVGKMRARWGGFIPDITSFDARLFNILPLEAQEIDPRQRLLLMSTWRTLEDAGYEPLSLEKSNTGVFIGCETNEYAQLMRDKGITCKGMFNQSDSMMSNRISYFFDFAGPSEVINTMCSGFAVALHRAVVALKSKTIDRAIVGAANLILSPELMIALSNGNQMCTSELVKSFGDGGDGYLSSEGVGTIMIERLEDAQKNEKHVYAIIKNTAVNYNGKGGMSMASPNMDSHKELIKKCYREAEVDPRHLAYIESQGMGLPVADIAEWNAINSALTELAEEQKVVLAAGSCAVSSLKPMIGHMHSASSLGALIKVIRSFRTKRIHKLIGFENPNAYCDMDNTPCKIAQETFAWDNKGYARLAGIHSYGSGGNNAHILLEEMPETDCAAKASIAERPFQLKKYWFEDSKSGEKESNLSDEVQVGKNAEIQEDIEIKKEDQAEQKKSIHESIRGILGLELQESDLDTPFSSLGVDSVSVGIFTSNLHSKFGVLLPRSDVYGYPTIEKMTDFLLTQMNSRKTGKTTGVKSNGHKDSQESFDQKNGDSGDAGSNDIAIIGLAVQTAGAKNATEFWGLLKNGECSIAEIPENRRSAEFDQLEMARGGFINDVDKFDPLFFNISPREANLMDPRHRILLQSAYSAIEDSGYTAESWKGKENGIFIGIEESDYPFTANSSITSVHSGTAPARIGYFLDTKGPLLSLNTACSSSLVAVHYACKSILSGESECALAGGCNILSDPAHLISNLSRMGGMLSPDGTCYAFDDRANGMVLGEGVGIVVLKKYSDAIRDNDSVYGVIKGSGINYDGRTNGLTAPSGVRQQELYENVCVASGITPDQIQHVVAHGTGTSLGDPIECNALIRARGSSSDKKQYCALTSIKTNIGHSLGASGVINLIAATLSVKNQQIPPAINFDAVNRDIAITGSPFFINNSLVEWNEPKKYAAVSAFGHTGTNAHAIIGEHIPKKQTSTTETGDVLIVLSAKDKDRLKEYVGNLLAFVEDKGSTIDISDLAYTLQTGRSALSERIGLKVKDIAHLIKILQMYLKGNSSMGNVYQGTISGTGAEFLNGLSQDDIDSLISKWKNDNATDKLLNAWVNGVDVSWQDLYIKKGARKKINAPTYPFAKESYWVQNDVKRLKSESILVHDQKAEETELVDYSSKSIEDRAILYVRDLIADYLRIPKDKIDNTVALDYYGLDSIMIGELTNILQKNIHGIDSTLFFQCTTIEEITDYLFENENEAFTKLVNSSGAIISDGNDLSKLIEETEEKSYDQRAVCCVKPVEKCSARILAFHPFGFGMKSLAWTAMLDDDIEVWAVGSTEIDDWNELVNYLSEEVKDLFDMPIIAWGHSMGGILGFEVLHTLESKYNLQARKYVVSSSASPDIFERLKFKAPFYEINESMSSEEVEQELIKNHYVVPTESGLPVISKNALLKDVKLAKSYMFDAKKQIRTPLYMVQASNDILIRDPSVIVRWEHRTTGECKYEEVEGTHLFFIRPPQGFIDLITNSCREKQNATTELSPGVYVLEQVVSGTSDVHLFPLGTKPKGFIIYSANGKMAAHLWHPQREHAVSGDKAGVEELLTYASYSGDYSVDKGIVKHNVLVSIQPDLEDKTLCRYIQSEAEGITLLASPLITAADGQFGFSDYQKISWKRIINTKRSALENYSGAWSLANLKGIGEELNTQQFKGQCIITEDGFISVVIDHQKRDHFYHKNFSLASSDEINESLRSFIGWFGQLSHSNNENEFAQDIMVQQTYGPMALHSLNFKLEHDQLIMSWHTKEDEGQKLIAHWELVPSSVDDELAAEIKEELKNTC